MRLSRSASPDLCWAAPALALWTLANRDDAAGDDHVQAERLGPGEQLWTFGAGIEPNFAYRFLGYLLDHFQADFGRYIEANPIKLGHRYVENRTVGRQAFDDRRAGMDRKDLVALADIGAHGPVAVFVPLGAGADNGNCPFQDSFYPEICSCRRPRVPENGYEVRVRFVVVSVPRNVGVTGSKLRT